MADANKKSVVMDTIQKDQVYACTNCGRDIFYGRDITGTKNLWDLREYQAEAYMIAQAIDVGSLRRYDTSLHEGWYCCRFIMMLMIEDKFGTGDSLLVYRDAVAPHPVGEKPVLIAAHTGQISLTIADFDDVTTTTDDRLKIVKLGAIWCPPCRLVDQVIAGVVADNVLPEVDFFAVDVDDERKLASRFTNRSIPLTLFYYGGHQIELDSPQLPIVDGGVIGGFMRRDIVSWSEACLAAGRAGKLKVRLP